MSCSGLGRQGGRRGRKKKKSTERPLDYITQTGNMQQRERESEREQLREDVHTDTFLSCCGFFFGFLTFYSVLFSFIRQQSDIASESVRERQWHKLSDPPPRPLDAQEENPLLLRLQFNLLPKLAGIILTGESAPQFVAWHLAHRKSSVIGSNVKFERATRSFLSSIKKRALFVNISQRNLQFTCFFNLIAPSAIKRCTRPIAANGSPTRRIKPRRAHPSLCRDP